MDALLHATHDVGQVREECPRLDNCAVREDIIRNGNLAILTILEALYIHLRILQHER